KKVRPFRTSERTPSWWIRSPLKTSEAIVANTMTKNGPSSPVLRKRTRGSASSDSPQRATNTATRIRYGSSEKGMVTGIVERRIGISGITSARYASSECHCSTDRYHSADATITTTRIDTGNAGSPETTVSVRIASEATITAEATAGPLSAPPMRTLMALRDVAPADGVGD